MTKRVWIQSQELEQAAERAGGFVPAPGTIKPDPVKKAEFAKIRRYALEHKIPIPDLTAEDYQKMGIKR